MWPASIASEAVQVDSNFARKNRLLYGKSVIGEAPDQVRAIHPGQSRSWKIVAKRKQPLIGVTIVAAR
jgi:hypothetical protein